MDKKLETMFDIVEVGGDALVLDSTEITALLDKQRILTMERVAIWLRNNSAYFTVEQYYGIANELLDLADDLDHIANLKNV